ncbi:hypothetical protein B0H34DRAFT_803102 [Crassisporium funariophilum]|nr:hypothetical protein B0H34DRAFT_803102 [Crassisporium funariophilum]
MFKLRSTALHALLVVPLSILHSTSGIALTASEGYTLSTRGIGPDVNSLKGSGSSNAGNALPSKSNAPPAWTCSVAVQTVTGDLTYSTEFPNQLQFINWGATGAVECTKAMSRISFSVYALNPQGEKITIASASPCVGCATLAVKNTNYYCQQPEVGGKCAGEWRIGYDAVITAPPGEPFENASGSCVARGATLTCSATGEPGTALPFAYIKMPDGYQDKPQLDDRAIDGILDTHYEGGVSQDDSKGLFLGSVTEDGLQTIFRGASRNVRGTSVACVQERDTQERAVCTCSELRVYG